MLNLVLHSQALNHSAQKLITMSLSYFIVDSFTMLDRKYLQHHIATIVCMLFVLLQPMTSTIHASVVLSVFELGALMVQASRWVRNDLRVRFAFCTGYTGVYTCVNRNVLECECLVQLARTPQCSYAFFRNSHIDGVLLHVHPIRDRSLVAYHAVSCTNRIRTDSHFSWFPRPAECQVGFNPMEFVLQDAS